MYLGFHEEGDKCPDCKDGVLGCPKPENCSCHINPPCSACTDLRLTCNVCGWEDDAPDSAYVPVADGISMLEHRPKPLDPTKIDWRVKMHTHFSMICEGVYPEGTTRDQVLEQVKGTFGGRFEHFGNGKFKYIAYTD